jgi:hypothetical protein
MEAGVTWPLPELADRVARRHDLAAADRHGREWKVGDAPRAAAERDEAWAGGRDAARARGAHGRARAGGEIEPAVPACAEGVRAKGEGARHVPRHRPPPGGLSRGGEPDNQGEKQYEHSHRGDRMAGMPSRCPSALKLHEVDAASLQCANVRRRSAPLIRSLLRLIARSPGRACVYLLVGTVTIGGAIFSVIEPDADWFDGVWWTIVTLTTVGYGDYSPESFAGRWLAAFVMAGGIGAVAILTGILADEIREAKILDKDETPELDDDIEHVMAIMAAELQKLQTKVSHPEVVAALRKVHHDSKEKAL